MSGNTEKQSVLRDYIDDQNYKAHAESGVHYLTDTNPAPEGIYYGFIVHDEATIISSITYINGDKQTGDITGLVLIPGMYMSIPGLFSTMTISAGSVQLLKKDV